jgi:hypothetical protein
LIGRKPRVDWERSAPNARQGARVLFPRPLRRRRPLEQWCCSLLDRRDSDAGVGEADKAQNYADNDHGGAPPCKSTAAPPPPPWRTRRIAGLIGIGIHFRRVHAVAPRRHAKTSAADVARRKLQARV